MALKFMDGFDAYGTTNAVFPTAIDRRWQTLDTWDITVENGRLAGGKSVRLAGRGSGEPFDPADLFGPLLGNLSTGIIGFGFKTTALINGYAFVTLMEGDGSIEGVNLRLTSAGAIAIYRQSTLLATSSDGIIAIDQWYHIELKVLVANSGTYEVRVNGVNVLSGSADTQQFAFANFNSVLLSGIAWIEGDFDEAYYFDDLFILDATGGVNDNFLGNQTVFTRFADGAGSSTQFTPDTGTNYERVNENPNDDPSYVQSSTVGHKDLYAYDDLDFTDDIIGLQITSLVRLTSGGDDLQMFHVAKSDATEDDSAQIQPFFEPTTRAFSSVYENDPDTAAPWTMSGVNAAEFGMKVD